MSNKLKNVKAVKEMLMGNTKPKLKKQSHLLIKLLKEEKLEKLGLIIKVKSGNNEKVTKLKLENFLNLEKS